MDKSNKALVFNTMDSRGFVRVSKVLVKKLDSFCAAGLLCELISKMKQYEGDDENEGVLLNDSGKVSRDGKWFFYTRKKIEEDFRLSEFQQRSILTILEDKGVVESKIFENMVPQRKYYTINFDKVVELLS